LLQQSLQRLANGDIGSLPVLLGLVLIAVVFQIANSNFLTPLNLTNLMVQISSVGTIAVGVVLVLLIGEIDLSVGAVSGLCAGLMGVLSVKLGLPGVPTVLLSLLAGFLIGLFQGWWITKLHVPSFVVTLAGYLGWQGALLWVLCSTGIINLNDLFIVGLANTRLPVWLGWTIGAAAVAIFLLASAGLQIRKSRQSLHSQSVLAVILRGMVIAIVVLGPVAIMSVNRNPRGNVPGMGVPTAVVILLAIIIAFNFLTKRTRYGRYVFAVGGGRNRRDEPVWRARQHLVSPARGPDHRRYRKRYGPAGLCLLGAVHDYRDRIVGGGYYRRVFESTAGTDRSVSPKGGNTEIRLT